jgi:hypothetical protein
MRIWLLMFASDELRAREALVALQTFSARSSGLMAWKSSMVVQALASSSGITTDHLVISSQPFYRQQRKHGFQTLIAAPIMLIRIAARGRIYSMIATSGTEENVTIRWKRNPRKQAIKSLIVLA